MMQVYRSYIMIFLLAFFFALMGRITLQYLPIRTDAAFLQIKQNYISFTPWLIAFFIHVFTSILALVAGFTQFSGRILRDYKKVHRVMGQVYVVDVLFITGPASLLMAFLANGGLSSRVAFTCLSVLWMYTTAKGWRAVLVRRFADHEEWMMRSYALTLSAVTLRAWKWLLIALFHLRPLDAYMIVSWLGFVPNLVVVELIIRRSSWRGRRSIGGGSFPPGG
jgi:hypothetical protein